MTLFAPLAPAAAINPGDLDTTFGGNGSINVTELFGQYVNVDKIKTDSDNRTVVLASYEDEDGLDNHILFRLNADGSYDNAFGESGPLIGKNYVLVAQTDPLYIFERVDLEIDFQDRMLVMLSGSNGFGIGGSINFVRRYQANGSIDANFGNAGRIDLSPNDGEPFLFLTDLTIDNLSTEGGFLVAGFVPIPNRMGSDFGLGMDVHKFDKLGDPVTEFGNKDDENHGVAEIDTEILLGFDDVIVSDVRIVSDHADGYTIAYFGVTNFGEGILPSTGLLRLTGDGEIDEEFACIEDEEEDEEFGCVEDDFLEIFSSSDPLIPTVDNHRLLHGFIFTDIVPDGLQSDGLQSDAGILISGTFAPDIFSPDALSLLLRIEMDGTFDQSFSQSARINGVNYILNSPNVDEGISASDSCFNLAMFRNVDRSDSITALIVGDICDVGSSATALLAFLKSGEVDENFGSYGAAVFSTMDSESTFTNLITQLEQTKNGELLVLRGAEPTSGIFGFELKLAPLFGAVPDLRDGVVTISRYHLRQPVRFKLMLGSETSTASVEVTESATVGLAINSYNVLLSNRTDVFSGDADSSFSISPSLPAGLSFDTSTARISGVPTVPLATQIFTITGELVTLTEFGYIYRDIATATYTLTVNAAATPPAPTPPAPVVVYVAPKPVPYLRTISAPQLKLKEDKLVCSAGAYQTGNTLEGVIQPNSITPFTPIRYLFNLIVGGITQSATAITSGTSSASWDLSTVPAGSVVSCSVTVSAGAITNTDKSTENTSGLSSALSAQSNSIAAAESAYGISLNANSKAYQKALVDNRAKWRSDVEKIRTDYYAERDRIKSLPSTRVTRALASAALKAYTAAQKKSTADYKASQPAAAAARDAANKAALDAKNAAIAKANATYGTFIESIGYGVLIP